MNIEVMNMQAGTEWSRRGFLRVSGGVAAAGLTASLLASCSKANNAGGIDQLETLKKQGYVTAGFADSAPYCYTDKNGRVTGEGPEVARAVFKRLGVPEIQAKLVSFDGLIPGMNAGQFDVIAAGLWITPKRCANALFSSPDYIQLQSLVVPKGNPKQIKNFGDIASQNLTLSAINGAAALPAAQAAGVKNIVLYSDNNQMVQAVQTGRADASLGNNLEAPTLLQGRPDVEMIPGFQMVLNGKPVLNLGAFTFRNNEQGLVDAFNRELKAIHDSGEWLEIVKPFGWTKENLPPAGVTVDQLCSAS